MSQAFTMPAYSADIDVNSMSDGAAFKDGFCTLREAIMSAQANDLSIECEDGPTETVYFNEVVE